MVKRFLCIILAIFLLFTLVLAGCGKKGDPGQTGESTKPGGTKPKGDEEEQIEWPDELPDKPVAAPLESYDYDDMSKQYDVSIIVTGLSNQPIPHDRIKMFLEEKFNVSITFESLPGDQLESQLALRFANDDDPDLIVAPTTSINMVKALYEQGFLAEVSDILPLMPNAAQYVTKTYKQWATYEGDMIGIPRYPTFPDNWGYFVRTDWLEALDMNMPTTDEELFEYAMAVTYNDPDDDGVDDTWFAGGAGEGVSFGMLEGLRSMYGHPGINVADGVINHPLLDGSNKKFLEFMKKLNDNGLLSPDWFTIGWFPFMPYWNNDQIGMVHYPPPNLLGEYLMAKGGDESVLDIWTPIPQPLKEAGSDTALAAPGGAPGGIFIFSAKAAENEGKIKRIAHMLDRIIFPGDAYLATVLSGGADVWPNNGFVEGIEDGRWFRYIDEELHDPEKFEDPETVSPGCGDWQWVAITTGYNVDKTEPLGPLASSFNDVILAFPRHTNYDLLLTLDPVKARTSAEFVIQNEIAFILGDKSLDEYDNFVNEWLRNYHGQELLDAAADQLGVERYTR